MKILVTGSNGQLGSELKDLSREYPSWEFIFTDEGELDITNKSQVQDFFEKIKPDVTINCAAYTAVDKAESEEKTAFLVNATAPGILAEASAKTDSLLIHISTDYVFDGRAHLPYKETDETNPISLYGKSKMAGEVTIRQNASKALIIRTSWLYSAYGHNFVKTIRKIAREKEHLNIVFDQIGTPTYAHDLARTILCILPSAVNISGIELYHFSNEGVASWYDFAKAIVEESGINCNIDPITSDKYPTAASRPFYSILNKIKIRNEFPVEIPYWRDSLRRCIAKLSDDEIKKA